ncbi:MAG: hypothetical protein Q4B84_03505 [Clostridia bacterium]|nr:hypothetical protein [Clostridia bacterium]
MNNSIVKLEDNQLDEISGGVNIDKAKAKQVAKKVGAYAVKGTSSLVLGAGTFFLSAFAGKKLEYGYALCGFLKEKLGEFPAVFITADVCLGIPTAFAGVAGWNFGSWLCKKLGLED